MAPCAYHKSGNLKLKEEMQEAGKFNQRYESLGRIGNLILNISEICCNQQPKI